ncbi:MAG: serine/threonine protein phosphatase, partial [Clostridia bacterium]|nr:serine/threonine protein phosphatase [Clostridia bacterium]
DTLKIIHNGTQEVGGVCVCGTRGWFFDQNEGGDRKILLREAGRLEASLAAAEKTGLEPVAFLHFPPVYGGYECDELISLLQKYDVRRCYYGHLHGKAAAKAMQGEYRGILFRLVSCDAVGFSPVIVA